MVYDLAIHFCIKGHKIRRPHWNNDINLYYDGKNFMMDMYGKDIHFIPTKLDFNAVDWTLCKTKN